MKVQFNLLPDVKQAYIKAQRTRRTVTAIAFVVTAALVAIFIIMLSVVYGVNKLQLSNADKNIKKYQDQLNNMPDLNKVLTVQNQLKSLSSLHQDKKVVSRVFGFLPQLTPDTVSLGSLNMDLDANTMQIKGTADSQKSINTYIDTLKFTTYKIDGKDTGQKAFPNVVESNVGFEKKDVSYGLSIEFAPDLFLNSGNVTLNVPQGLATTRSVLNDPANLLFNGKTGDEDKQNSVQGNP